MPPSRPRCSGVRGASALGPPNLIDAHAIDHVVYLTGLLDTDVERQLPNPPPGRPRASPGWSTPSDSAATADLYANALDAANLFCQSAHNADGDAMRRPLSITLLVMVLATAQAAVADTCTGFKWT